MKLNTRASGAELMDAPLLEGEEIRAALEDLKAVNRWLGGWRVLRTRMARLLAALPPGEYSVIDVGTGGADLPIRLSRWARGRGYRLRVLATDVHPQTVEVARAEVRADPDVSVARADALALEYEDDAFDFGICSTTLHHFDNEAAARVLAELRRVSRRGMIVNDLRRSRLAFLGARLLARTAWRRSRLTRHDGPLSVRRAFTSREMTRLAAEAGLSDAEIRTHFPFRLSLTAGNLVRNAAR
jgi:ubiquinone/menaquinone biosynthesis C-methylase UbiE